MMQHEICFDPYFLYKMGWIKQTSAGKDKASFSLLTNPWEKIWLAPRYFLIYIY